MIYREGCIGKQMFEKMGGLEAGESFEMQFQLDELAAYDPQLLVTLPRTQVVGESNLQKGSLLTCSYNDTLRRGYINQIDADTIVVDTNNIFRILKQNYNTRIIIEKIEIPKSLCLDTIHENHEAIVLEDNNEIPLTQ